MKTAMNPIQRPYTLRAVRPVPKFGAFNFKSSTEMVREACDKAVDPNIRSDRAEVFEKLCNQRTESLATAQSLGKVMGTLASVVIGVIGLGLYVFKGFALMGALWHWAGTHLGLNAIAIFKWKAAVNKSLKDSFLETLKRYVNEPVTDFSSEVAFHVQTFLKEKVLKK